MKRLFSILGLVLFLSNIGSAQCADLYFLRSNKGFLSLDSPVRVVQDDNMICNISKGERYHMKICSSGTYYFSASLASDDISLFSNKTINITEGEKYYIKVGIVPGIDEPSLSIMSNLKGERLLHDNRAFNSELQELQIQQLSQDIEIEELPENDIEIISETPTQDISIESNSRTINNIPEEVLVGNISPVNEYNYYFFFGDKLIDIRDYSVVIDGVRSGEVKELEDGNIVICSFVSYGRNSFAVFDENNSLTKTFEVTGYLSPNWDYIIYHKDGDLWRGDIDFKTGTTYNSRQITELGLFEKTFNYYNWYKDYVLFLPYSNNFEESYILDTKNGQLSKAPFGLGYDPFYSSPTGRFFQYMVDNEFLIYDFEKREFIDNIRGGNSYWFNETTIAINEESDNTSDFRIINLENPTKNHIVEYAIHTEGVGPSMFKNYINYWGGIKYSEFKKLQADPIINSNNFFFQLNGHVYLTDITTSKSILWANSYKDLHFSDYPQYNDIIQHAWISRDEIVYCFKGSLIEQGTWVLNCKTGIKKKITPFLAEKFWDFESIGYVLFKANNNLYSYSEDDGLKLFQENVRNSITIEVLKSRY